MKTNRHIFINLLGYMLSVFTKLSVTFSLIPLITCSLVFSQSKEKCLNFRVGKKNLEIRVGWSFQFFWDIFICLGGLTGTKSIDFCWEALSTFLKHHEVNNGKQRLIKVTQISHEVWWIYFELHADYLFRFYIRKTRTSIIEVCILDGNYSNLKCNVTKKLKTVVFSTNNL